MARQSNELAHLRIDVGATLSNGPKVWDRRRVCVARRIRQEGTIQTGDGALHSFHSHAAGLINPLADQRKINVGLLWLGSDMTAMIVIVFSIALALLLAYFIK